MDYKLVIQELKKLGDHGTFKTMESNGLAKQYLGVNLTKLKTFAKSIQKNHELASQLWKSDIHDAQVLATFIEDSRKVKEDQINQWIKDVDSTELGDKFCVNILLKTSFAYKKMKEWIRSSDSFSQRGGFITLALIAKKDEWLSDEEYIEFLDFIRLNIHSASNMVKEAMNQALIAIGSRSKRLNEKAVAYANQIGELHLDNGYSNMKIPKASIKLTDKKLLSKLNHQIV